MPRRQYEGPSNTCLTCERLLMGLYVAVDGPSMFLSGKQAMVKDLLGLGEGKDHARTSCHGISVTFTITTVFDVKLVATIKGNEDLIAHG